MLINCKMAFLRPICYRAAYTTMKGVLRHVGLIHSQDANFHVVCGIEGCCRIYTNYLSYKKHMYRKHRTTLELSLTAQAQSETIDTMQTSILECENSDDDALMDVSIDFKKRHSALLLLKMKQTYKMSEIAVDSIISDISLLLQNRTDELRLQLCDKVPTHEEKINEVFNSPQLPFCGLETKYLRHRYFVNTLKLQVSDMHIL